MKALLALEDGRIFRGYAFGAPKERGGEVVFNTSMTGYQEILTDPSYKGQIVTLTYPLIGNYGINSNDVESAKPQVEGLIVREKSSIFSNWRAEKSLEAYLEEHEILGVERIDTRALTKHIREKGAMRGFIALGENLDAKLLVEKARSLPEMSGQDLVKVVTTSKPYLWQEKGIYKIVVIDCGVKFNILRELAKRKCRVEVYPAFSTAKEILAAKPAGVLFSNGPGDPAALPYLVECAQQLIGKVPIFGICLGHQILSLALGGSTFKLKFGHHGGNHPVKDLFTERVTVTAQNHGFAVDPHSLPHEDVEITHLNLNDNTLEGIKHKKLPLFSVQFHPEAGPGPHDTTYLFDNFMSLVEESHA